MQYLISGFMLILGSCLWVLAFIVKIFFIIVSIILETPLAIYVLVAEWWEEQKQKSYDRQFKDDDE